MSTENIIIGAGKIWFAPVGEALPAAATVGYGSAWGGNWAYLGDTLEAITITPNAEHVSIETQQSQSDIKSIRVKVAPTLSSSLADFDPDNLVLALGGTNTPTAAGSGTAGFDTYTFGGQFQETVKAWGVETVRVTDDGDELPVRYFFYKGTFQFTGDQSVDKRSTLGTPFTIKVLEDRTKAVGAKIGVIHNVTAVAE